MRVYSILAAAGLCVAASVQLSCTGWFGEAKPANGETACAKVTGMPGPEDLALDRWHAKPRLLVSSYDRWNKADEGQIFAVDLATEQRSAPLTRSGEPPSGHANHFTFRPQGIDIRRTAAGETLLFVVVHGADPLKDNAVATYRLVGEKLEFVDVIKDRKLLTDPNDVAVGPDGRLFITNFDDSTTGITKTWNYLFNHPASRLIMCDPSKHERRCSVIAQNVAAGNGVVFSKGRVIAAAFFADYLFGVEWTPSGHIVVRRFAPVPKPDNITMADDGSLLVASHDLPTFLLHWRFKRKAPSAIYRIIPDGDSPSADLLFVDDGEFVQAASTGLLYRNKLYVGQMFQDGIVAVTIPRDGTGGVLHCRAEATAPAPAPTATPSPK